MKERNIDFVAKHYRQGAFSAEKGLHRMGFNIKSRWRGFRIAAAVVSIVAVTAVASIIIHNEYASEGAVKEVMEQATVKPDLKTVRSIDFDNAPLTTVTDEIKEVYGVEVSGLPDNASTYHLTLHYEGNARDLVDTINEILATKLTIKE